MAKTKLPPANDWRARNIYKWNATTFGSYLEDTHEDLYGIPYVTRSYGMERRLIRKMIDDYGGEVTKRFIDVCFEMYKPTTQYPGINFAFMYSYMKERHLPPILADLKAEEVRKERKERINEIDYEKIADLL